MRLMRRLEICVAAMLCLALIANAGFAEVERTEIWVDNWTNDFDNPIPIEVGKCYFVDEGNAGWMKFQTGEAGDYRLTTEAITGAITVEIYTKYEEKLCRARAAFASDGASRVSVHLQANAQYWARLYFLDQLSALLGKAAFSICGPGRHAGERRVARGNPTCTQAGFEVDICEICGMDLTEKREIPATGHEYTEWEVLHEATREVEGERQRHCVRCGDTQREKIPKLPKFLGLF